jgi:hypothetical protein
MASKKKVPKLNSTKVENILTDLAQGEENELETKRRRNRLHMRMARLADRAVDTLEEILNEGGGREKLEAAKIILRSQGMDVAPETQNDSTLTVVLPSGVTVSTDKPKTLEVKNEIQDSEN